MGHQMTTDPAPKKRPVQAQPIGNTPLQPIDLEIHGVVHRVHLKLEGANPGGSIKDRTAFALIRDLEYRKVLNEDSIIVASTSGNLGVALSMLLQKANHHNTHTPPANLTGQPNKRKRHLLGRATAHRRAGPSQQPHIGEQTLANCLDRRELPM